MPIIGVLALIAAGLLGYRGLNSPGAPPPASAAQAEAVAAPHTVRLVSFNIYNRPWARKGRFRTTLATLRDLDPDLIALEEVAEGWILPGNPAEYLAQGLGLHFARAWHEKNLGIFATGLTILSRYPILSTEYHEFAEHDFWDAKGYLYARIGTPDGPLQFIALHMASTHNLAVRESEWDELARFALSHTSQGPVLIAGDFNTEPEDPTLKKFVRATHSASIYDGRTDIDLLRSWTPDYRDSCAHSHDPDAELLDYVFVVPSSAANARPASLKLSDGKIIDPQIVPHPSDHCPIAVAVHLDSP